jgi:hypothetical protein
MAELVVVSGTGTAPGTGPSSYILRPGGVAGGNVYTTWASLVAAYAAGANQELDVVFDDSIVSPIVLPANTANAPWVVPYDMNWVGKHLGTQTTVHLADGFNMTGPGGMIGVNDIRNNLAVTALADSAGSNISPFNPTADDQLVIEYGASIGASVDLPLLVCAPGKTTVIALGIGGSILNAGTPTIGIPLTAACLVVAAVTYCDVAASTFAGAGSLDTIISGPTTTVLTHSYEQTGVLGSVTIQYLSPSTAIPDPPAAHNADTTAAASVNEPIMQWAPTATRKFDPRDAPNSMGITFIKTNAAAFGLVIDVTTGGNQGWTTPGGLNTDYTLFNSAAAAAGSWLVRIDRPNKTVIATPVS